MRLYFAPMEGVVDHPLRQIYEAIGGVDICVTEFIRVTHTRLPNKVFYKYCPELNRPSSTPVRVQLLGSNIEMLAYNAQKAASLGAPAIDLNFGCPAKTVNRHKGGACLLQEPKLLHDIVAGVRKAVPSAIPVTAKIRLGYNAREGYVENALAIEEAGASELVVHGRSKVDSYKPPAYWAEIGEIQGKLKIPVVANGEIWSVEDYRRCRQESNCKDFMLGRGLLAKPDLALAIKADFEGKPYTELEWSKVVPHLHLLYLNTLDKYPARYLGNRIKQWLMYLRREYKEADCFFEAIKKKNTEQEFKHVFNEHLNTSKSNSLNV